MNKIDKQMTTVKLELLSIAIPKGLRGKDREEWIRKTSENAPVDMNVEQALSRRARQISNYKDQIARVLRHRLNMYHNDPDYHVLAKRYAIAKKHGTEKDVEEVGKQYAELQHKYGLDRRSALDVHNVLYKHFPLLNSVWALSAFDDVYRGVENVLYGDGKGIRTDRVSYLSSIRGKQIDRGLAFHYETGDVFSVTVLGIGQLLTRPISADDLYLQEQTAALRRFFDAPKTAMSVFSEHGSLREVYIPKYVTIVAKECRHHVKFYAHITCYGIPPVRKDKNGNTRHEYAQDGMVAIDCNVAAAAFYDGERAEFYNIPENNARWWDNPGWIEKKNKKIADAQRKNSHVVEPRKHGKSRSVRRREKLVRLESARLSASREYACREEANVLRSRYVRVVTEPDDISIWKEKSARGAYAGKNIQSRCVGEWKAAIRYRFCVSGGLYDEVAKFSYRASQRDHTDESVLGRVSPSVRVRSLSDGNVVQRDLYSAFLLYCHNSAMTQPDIGKCVSGFPVFQDACAALFDELSRSGRSVVNSGFEELIGVP